MNIQPLYNRHDLLTSDLCAEIDELHDQVKYWKKEAEYWKNQHCDLVNRDIKHGQEMVGGFLMLALKGPEIFGPKGNSTT